MQKLQHIQSTRSTWVLNWYDITTLFIFYHLSTCTLPLFSPRWYIVPLYPDKHDQIETHSARIKRLDWIFMSSAYMYITAFFFQINISKRNRYLYIELLQINNFEIPALFKRLIRLHGVTHGDQQPLQKRVSTWLNLSCVLYCVYTLKDIAV